MLGTMREENIKLSADVHTGAITKETNDPENIIDVMRNIVHGVQVRIFGPEDVEGAALVVAAIVNCLAHKGLRTASETFLPTRIPQPVLRAPLHRFFLSEMEGLDCSQGQGRLLGLARDPVRLRAPVRLGRLDPDRGRVPRLDRGTSTGGSIAITRRSITNTSGTTDGHILILLQAQGRPFGTLMK